jgi:hypothetical protein
MTSATAGKPTVAPLTTLEDRTLRTRGRPIHIGVGRACAQRPTKNEADLRLARGADSHNDSRDERAMGRMAVKKGQAVAIMWYLLDIIMLGRLMI